MAYRISSSWSNPWGQPRLYHGVSHMVSPYGLTRARRHGFTIKHTTACPMAYTMGRTTVWIYHGMPHEVRHDSGLPMANPTGSTVAGSRVTAVLTLRLGRRRVNLYQ